MRAVWLAHQDLQNPTDELRDAVRELPAFANLDEAAFDAGGRLAVASYQGATPLTTQEMFDNEVFLVNYNRDSPIRFGFGDIYNLSAAEAAKT
jgi:NitT/TauT family transport system substrate-binding protein